jgi:hypothetical protein
VARPGTGTGTERPLRSLATATSLALWSADDPGPEAVERAWSDLEDLEQSFREATPRSTRIRRALARLLAPPETGPERARKPERPGGGRP